jgi:hypothetical protein
MKMLWGWWYEEVARQLQRFHDEFAAGLRHHALDDCPAGSR